VTQAYCQKHKRDFGNEPGSFNVAMRKFELPFDARQCAPTGQAGELL